MGRVSVTNANRNLSKIFRHACHNKEVIILTSQGKPKEIPIGLDAFQHIIGLDGKMDFPSTEEIRRVLRQDLEEAEYTSGEGIVTLSRM